MYSSNSLGTLGDNLLAVDIYALEKIKHDFISNDPGITQVSITMHMSTNSTSKTDENY